MENEGDNESKMATMVTHFDPSLLLLVNMVGSPVNIT